MGVLVGVGVAGAKLIEEQPLTLGNSSVSQITRMQREKNRKRGLNTVMDTSNKGDTFLALGASWLDVLMMVIIAHLDELGYFWYLFPIDFRGGYGMLKGRLRVRGGRRAREMSSDNRVLLSIYLSLY